MSYTYFRFWRKGWGAFDPTPLDGRFKYIATGEILTGLNIAVKTRSDSHARKSLAPVVSEKCPR